MHAADELSDDRMETVSLGARRFDDLPRRASPYIQEAQFRAAGASS
jgi:hypothetical protein